MIISPARDSNGGSQYLVLLTVSVKIKQVMGQKKKKKKKKKLNILKSLLLLYIKAVKECRL